MLFDRNLTSFAYEMPTTSAMVSFSENPEMIQNDMRQPKEYEVQVHIKQHSLKYFLTIHYF